QDVGVESHGQAHDEAGRRSDDDPPDEAPIDPPQTSPELRNVPVPLRVGDRDWRPLQALAIDEATVLDLELVGEHPPHTVEPGSSGHQVSSSGLPAATIPPGCSSARPASASSIRAANTAEAGAPAARTSSSRETGVGESRSATRSRSASSGSVGGPRNGVSSGSRKPRRPSSARSTSSAPSQIAAPWRIRSLVPLARGSSG